MPVRSNSFVLLLLLSLSFPMGAFAQVWPQDYERFLIPLYSQSAITGIGGTKWATTVSVVNQGVTPVALDGYVSGGICQIAVCPPVEPVPPQKAFYPVLINLSPDIPPRPTARPTFVWVEQGRGQDLSFTLRVQEQSQHAASWGVSIPVIHENDFLSTRSNLLDLPNGNGYRVRFRLYGLSDAPLRTLVLRVFAVDPLDQDAANPPGKASDRLLSETSHAFGPYGSLVPSFMEVELGDLVDPSSESGRVRVEIAPAPGLLYWAFASITSNETHDFTVIAPQAY